ncbi:MAG: glycosyltransferase family 2 protein [Acidimicrobiales bacterium]
MADQLLSVIVPVKDEAATVAGLITMIEETDVPAMAKEIIVVDDGSTDGTRSILHAYEGREGFTVLHHDRNRGKGRAIRTAIGKAAGSIVIIQDADHEYDPSDYAHLVEPILAGRTRVVYGSRFLGSPQGMAVRNRVANKVLAWTANSLGPSRITDEATCFKVFDAELLRSLPLRCEGFEFCPEVTGLLQGMREPIVEVPVTYAGRRQRDGKKVRARDGFAALWWLLQSRFFRREDQREATGVRSS